MNALTQILNSTPTYVWGILAFCIYVGISQSRDKQVKERKLVVAPIIWTLFGLWGIKTAVGLQASSLLVWAMGLGLVVAGMSQVNWPKGVRYDSSTQSYFVPGSWIPMAMILGIFLSKYVVGVSLSLNPALAHDANFALVLGGLYGALSGLFVARARRILQSGPTQAGLVAA